MESVLLFISGVGAILLLLFLLFMVLVVANDNVSAFYFEHEHFFSVLFAVILGMYGIPLIIWLLIAVI